MSADALETKKDLDDALVENGQTVTRIRPSYRDANGNTVAAQTITLRCLSGQTMQHYDSHDRLFGMGNLSASDYKTIHFFSGNADVIEEDILTINGWQYTVTLAEPIVIDDIPVVLIVNRLRTKRIE